MYNLLVSADKTAWTQSFYEYEHSRIFEHTPEYYCKEFNELNDATIERLIKYPALFVHEMFDGKSKIRFIKTVKKNYSEYHLDLEYYCDVSSKKLEKLQDKLGFEKSEKSRTHWAVKDIDLIGVLQDGKILTNEQKFYFRILEPLVNFEFDVAFSFPGEKRDIIYPIVEQLKKKGITIFYDKDFTEQLAKPNMDLILMDVYKKQSRLIYILLSKEYKNKKWCQLEWKSIREILIERDDNIMFLRYDDTVIPGVSSNDGYIDINQYSSEQIAVFIQKKLRIISKGRQEKLS
jgi:hypothetical protein